MKTFSTKRNLGEGKEDTDGSSWKETSSSTEGSSRRMPPEKNEGAAKGAHAESTSNSVPLENKGAHSVSRGVRAKQVILSKILYPLPPSAASSHHPIQSVRSFSQVTKLAGSYNEGAILDVRPINLSSTLEKLYVWEKKLYKEIKFQS